ncbi:MAG: orotidine-5'-phosphate decarboxylase [Candidatus Latescibacteria bacterium]|nr:orotidine-5'-phosphate decarboxylase [Candidatus Latescibacterota bacterium]
MEFINKIVEKSKKADSLVCIGLDTDPLKIPVHLRQSGNAVLEFNKSIITATKDLVCAYKPNAAFYEAMGSIGIEILEKTCRFIDNNIPIILDIKRGDIGNTAVQYAYAAYEIFGVDAVTVNPYMGFDAIKPFLRDGKGVFVLCLTSNPSAGDFQLLDTGGQLLYERVAHAAVEWAKEGEIGLVIGATRPETMQKIRDIVEDMPILVPGIGAQGGSIMDVITNCGGKPGRTIINSSRSILYASHEKDYAEAARSSLEKLRLDINKNRSVE